MEYILIGKIVNTHGIKGELRIISDFEHKNRIFKKGFNFYIGEKKIKETIDTYRHHKNFEMITLINYNNINQVLKYLKENVYILKDDLVLDVDEYLDEDLIGVSVIGNGKTIGKLVAIEKASPTNKIMVIENDKKRILIPYHKDFIVNIDLQNNKMEVKLIEGML